MATPALADSVVISEQGLGVLTAEQTEARIAKLRIDYENVNLTGPRAGVGVSSILVPGGALMIASGAVARSLETGLFCPPDNPRCGDPTAGSAVLVAFGVAAMIGGIVGVALSSRKLRRRKNERRRIQWQIEQLERSLP